MNSFWFTVYTISTAISLIVLGWLGHSLLDSQNSDRVLNGMWMDSRNWSEAHQIVNDRDPYGNWICVNLNGMTLSTMQQTIRHEIAHELFSQYCEAEQNFDKCIGLYNETEKNSN